MLFSFEPHRNMGYFFIFTFSILGMILFEAEMYPQKINNMKVIVEGTIKSSKEHMNILLSRRSNFNLKKIIGIFKRKKN